MNSKIVYLAYEPDMMATLGIETQIVTRHKSIEPILKSLEEKGVYIVYLSEALYQDNIRTINYYQNEKQMNLCVMGDAGASRMEQFAHSTLGIKIKKEESH